MHSDRLIYNNTRLRKLKVTETLFIRYYRSASDSIIRIESRVHRNLPSTTPTVIAIPNILPVPIGRIPQVRRREIR